MVVCVVCRRSCRRILLTAFENRVDHKVDGDRHNDHRHDLPQRETVIRVDVTFVCETSRCTAEHPQRKPKRSVFAFHGAPVLGLPAQAMMDNDQGTPGEQADAERRAEFSSPWGVLFNGHNRAQGEHPADIAGADSKHQQH